MALIGIISLIPTPPIGQYAAAEVKPASTARPAAAKSTLTTKTTNVEAAQAPAASEPVQSTTPTSQAAVGASTYVSTQITGTPAEWMAAAGIDASDYGYVDYIVNHEGGWGGTQRWNTAGSGAYGLCQALPGSKMAAAGDDWATNPVTQLKWCAMYASGAHGGGWYNNYIFWINNNWW